MRHRENEKTTPNGAGLQPPEKSGQAVPKLILAFSQIKPVSAGFVEHDDDWKYGSANHYANGIGMVKIEVLDL